MPAQIAATISSLPESAATQTSAQIGEREGKIRNVMRLELVKEEQRKIEEEEEEIRQMEEAERQKEIKEQEKVLGEVEGKEEAEEKKKGRVKQAVKKMDVPELVTLVTEARGQLKAQVDGEAAVTEREDISPEDLDYIK